MKDQLETLAQQISHEETMLKSWENGDTSARPEDWTQYEQSAFIQGMKHALDIIKNYKQY